MSPGPNAEPPVEPIDESLAGDPEEQIRRTASPDQLRAQAADLEHIARQLRTAGRVPNELERAQLRELTDWYRVIDEKLAEIGTRGPRGFTAEIANARARLAEALMWTEKHFLD